MEFPVVRKRKTLDNGMKVILIQKPGFAKSLFMIGVPAGGMNQKEIKGDHPVKSYPTGCAHFLEHQMFRLNHQDITPILASMQSQTNAFTDYTETCYYVSTSGDPLPPLGLLLDFVQTLDIDEQSVSKEKGIILSEFNIYNNQPDSRLLKACFLAMYHNHPIREDILGTCQDISNMKVEDLEDFYRTYYDPGQLVLVGITGRDLDPVFEFIEEKQKEYPSLSSAVPQRYFGKEPEEVLHKEMKFSMDISKPYCAMAFKLKVQKGHLENLKMDLLVNLWLDGIFEVLNPDFQIWMNDHIITQSAGAEADFSDDHAYILVYSQSEHPKKFFDLVQDLIQNKKPIDKEAFEALKIQYLASSLRSLDQFDNLAIDHIRGVFQGFDPFESIELTKSLDYDQMMNCIKSLDLSNVSRITIEPKKL